LTAYGPTAIQPAAVAAGLPENPEKHRNIQHFSNHPLPNIAGTCHKGFAFVLIPVGTLFHQAILTNGKETT
jgi:hypothetical protein